MSLKNLRIFKELTSIDLSTLPTKQKLDHVYLANTNKRASKIK